MFIRRQFTPAVHWTHKSADNVANTVITGVAHELLVPKDTNFRRVYYFQTSGTGGQITGRIRFSLAGQIASEIPFDHSSTAEARSRFSFGNPGFGLAGAASGPNILFYQLPGSAVVNHIVPLEISIACDRIQLVNDLVTTGAAWTSFLGVLSFITAN